jgi:hypothetical protein
LYIFFSFLPSCVCTHFLICERLLTHPRTLGSTLSRVSNTPYLYILYATLRALEVRVLRACDTCSIYQYTRVLYAKPTAGAAD